MPRRRIFIAIQVPEELKNTAKAYLGPFFNDKNMRIPKREGWHITVVFCGYLDDKEMEALTEIVKDVCLKFKPFEFVPQKILFAPQTKPRMIWLTFKDSSQFADLKNKIENTMFSYQAKGLFKSFRQETREPEPHLTLARFEESYFSNIKKFLPPEGVNLAKETKQFLVKSIDVMESHLFRTGAEYEKIFTADFSK